MVWYDSDGTGASVKIRGRLLMKQLLYDFLVMKSSHVIWRQVSERIPGKDLSVLMRVRLKIRTA